VRSLAVRAVPVASVLFVPVRVSLRSHPAKIAAPSAAAATVAKLVSNIRFILVILLLLLQRAGQIGSKTKRRGPGRKRCAPQSNAR
jgi:hypothetical protein